MYPWLSEKDFTLKLNNFKGTLYPFQYKGAAFLYGLKSCLLKDSTGLGKTVQTIAACDLYASKTPSLKFIIVTLASTQIQWEREFAKFLPTLKVKAVIGNKKTRASIYSDMASNALDGLILNYAQLGRDMVNPNDKNGYTGPLMQALNKKDYILILDEAQKCKSPGTATSKAAYFLSKYANGVKCLTATPFHNNLIDIYGIFKLISPKLFKNKEEFKKQFCYLDYSWSPWGTIVGYKNHELINKMISPFTLGRSKESVAPELPELISKDMVIELSDDHMEEYIKISREAENTEDTNVILGVMVKEQVCANNWKLEDGTYKHPKIDECLRILEEELVGEKVLIFSRYKTTIDLCEKVLNKNGISCYKVTGSEDQNTRVENISKWQNSPNTSVLMITMAGGAGLNLQAASTLIMIDRPWALGELDQIRGRIHRIGTKHSSLLQINLIAAGTIDEYVIDTIKNKQKNLSKVENIQVNSELNILEARCQFLKKLNKK